MYIGFNMFDHGKRIAELLKKYGWNQVYLAKRCNISQQTLSNIINGRRQKIRMETGQKIAAAFRMSLDEYLGKEEKTQEKNEPNSPLVVKFIKLIESVPDNDELLLIIEDIIDRRLEKRLTK